MPATLYIGCNVANVCVGSQHDLSLLAGGSYSLVFT